MQLTQPTTQDEARQQAIDWQNWQADHALSYEQIAEYEYHFIDTAKKFNLSEEFRENGII